MKKILFLLRGIPGSGKSTLAKSLAPKLAHKQHIFSTDDYWGPNYDFKMELIGAAHKWNQRRTEMAMEEGLNPIVVDNTNVTWREVLPYVEMAIVHNYNIEFKEPETDWWLRLMIAIKNNNSIEKEKVARILTNTTIHNVPFEVIQKMISRWQSTAHIEEQIKGLVHENTKIH
jgi:predicted kinase